jgi:hypothetical protein
MEMTTANELRSKAAALEGRKLEFAGERDEIAYEAHVAKASKRLSELLLERQRPCSALRRMRQHRTSSET